MNRRRWLSGLHRFAVALGVAGALGSATLGTAIAQDIKFFRIGTGGTAGVPYLRRMLDTVLFPELWKVRTDL